MFKTLTPIFALIVALALYFTYIDTGMDSIRDLEAQAAKYQEAVDTAGTLRERINELIADRNSISPGDLERLEVFLPDRIDEVELLIALDSLAKVNNLQLSNIDVENSAGQSAAELLGTEQAQNRPTAPQGPDTGYEPFDMNFVVTGTYDDVRGFIDELEESLQAIEIMRITFESSEGTGNSLRVGMSIRAFTLAPVN